MIEVKNLSKFYGSTKAVDNVSLSVRRGELFGLLGPNGSGKTTMIKMLTGQIKPTSGSLRVHGRSFRAVTRFSQPAKYLVSSFSPLGPA
ncbi:MAG: ATP-binding cassette domain-containing protein [Methanosarcina thermophila]